MCLCNVGGFGCGMAVQGALQWCTDSSSHVSVKQLILQNVDHETLGIEMTLPMKFAGMQTTP